jgi:hypothetical protein
MKTLMFAIAFAGSLCAVNAQDIPASQVPSVVLNTFKSKYSNATDIEWKLKNDIYHVEFEVEKKDHDLWIDKSGEITKHKFDMPLSETPDAVRQKIASEFKDYKIDDVDKVEMDGKILYHVDLDGKTDDREVLFSAEGNIEENKVD